MDGQFEFFTQGGIEGLKTFFQTEQEETERLEFKSGELSFTKLYQEVCALANTDGGVIIYGAPKEIPDPNYKGREHRKVCMGALCPSKEDKTKESFNQKLTTGIVPSIIGIRISKMVHEEGFVYIIDVPRSNYSPHQVDGTYYMRVGSSSCPAPHGFVQALFNKKKPIDLDFELNVHNTSKTQASIQLHDLYVGVTNKSDYPAHNVEGIIILTGKIREKAKTDQKKEFREELLKDYRRRLTKSVSFLSSVVLSLWTWYQLFDLIVEAEYYYVEIYIWAKDTPGMHKKFKVLQNGQHISINSNLEEITELKSWIVAFE